MSWTPRTKSLIGLNEATYARSKLQKGPAREHPNSQFCQRKHNSAGENIYNAKSVEKHDMGLSNSKTSWEAWDQTSKILYNDYLKGGAGKTGLNVRGGNDRRKALPEIENNPFALLS